MPDDDQTLDPLYLPLDAFRAGIDAVDDLTSAGKFRLLIGPPYRRIQFELREADCAELLKARSFSIAKFRGFLEDLEDLLLALTTGVAVPRILEIRSDAGRFEDGEHEATDVTSAKLELVGKTFDVPSLVGRVWVKGTAKTGVPDRFEWDVSVKTADHSEALRAKPVAFGTLKVTSAPATPRYPIASEGEVTIAVDLQDVEHMIDSLNRLASTLKAAHSQSDHE